MSMQKTPSLADLLAASDGAEFDFDPPKLQAILRPAVLDAPADASGEVVGDEPAYFHKENDLP